MTVDSFVKCNKIDDCRNKTLDVVCFEDMCWCQSSSLHMKLDYTCPDLDDETVSLIASTTTPTKIIPSVINGTNPSLTFSSNVPPTSDPHYHDDLQNFWFILPIIMFIPLIIMCVTWIFTITKIIYKTTVYDIELDVNSPAIQCTSNPNYVPFQTILADVPIEAMVPQFSKNSVTHREKIGEGYFGEVYKGQLHSVDKNGEHDKTVAIKMLKRKNNLEAVEDFWKELKTMSSIHHPNILSLEGFCPGDLSSPPSMIFEYMQFGDLAKVLRNSNLEFWDNDPTLPNLNTNDLFSCCLQIATGMKYLEGLKFIHRDLACRNCLLGSNLTVKISDFGMSRDLYACDYYRVAENKNLPVRWMSPESIMYGKFTAESDVWACGVVLWEIYNYGKQPYFGYTNERVIELIKEDSISLNIPNNCPEEVADIMKLCWKREPKNRIRFSEISDRLHKLKDSQTRIQ